MYRGTERITTVKRVTPTGRIKIDFNDDQFNKYGSQMGDNDAWFRSHIRKATPEDIARISQKEIIIKAYELCHTVGTKNLSYEKALRIIEILETASP